MTPFETIMEPRKTFISKTMTQPNVQMRLPMKVEPLKVEPNALKVTLTNLQ
jgi:hypothetical protein